MARYWEFWLFIALFNAVCIGNYAARGQWGWFAIEGVWEAFCVGMLVWRVENGR